MLARSIRSVPAARIGAPFKVAPRPRRARYSSSVTGLKMAPSSMVPPATKATETQKRGTPRTKFAVPSIGSTTQTWSPTSPPSSSPRK